jgi:hypothetical protein
VRAIFPLDAEALTGAEILALPAPPIGDGDTPAPGPYQPEPEPPRVGDWCGQWARAAGDGFDLHPDTAPDAIRAAQLAAVAEAREKLGPGATVEEIAAEAVLPLWNVRRLLNGDAR